MIASFSKLTAILIVGAFLFVGTSENLIAQGTGSGGTGSGGTGSGGTGQTGGGTSSGGGISLDRPELTTDINEISEQIQTRKILMMIT